MGPGIMWSCGMCSTPQQQGAILVDEKMKCCSEENPYSLCVLLTMASKNGGSWHPWLSSPGVVLSKFAPGELGRPWGSTCPKSDRSIECFFVL